MISGNTGNCPDPAGEVAAPFLRLEHIAADLRRVQEPLERTAAAAEADQQRLAVASLSGQCYGRRMEGEALGSAGMRRRDVKSALCRSASIFISRVAGRSTPKGALIQLQLDTCSAFRDWRDQRVSADEHC